MDIKHKGGLTMGYNLVECIVERCVHNMNDMCNAQYIHIFGNKAKQSQDTNCNTFELRTIRSSATTLTNVNMTGVVDQIFTEDPIMNPAIKCSVRECIYNINTQCSADRIEVLGQDSATVQQTECATFRRR